MRPFSSPGLTPPTAPHTGRWPCLWLTVVQRHRRSAFSRWLDEIQSRIVLKWLRWFTFCSVDVLRTLNTTREKKKTPKCLVVSSIHTSQLLTHEDTLWHAYVIMLDCAQRHWHSVYVCAANPNKGCCWSHPSYTKLRTWASCLSLAWLYC